jgi:hypothetical protein
VRICGCSQSCCPELPQLHAMAAQQPATLIEDPDFISLSPTIGLRRARTWATAQLMCDLCMAPGVALRLHYKLIISGFQGVAL